MASATTTPATQEPTETVAVTETVVTETQAVVSDATETKPKRHRKVLRNNLEKITRGDLRRLARRGGIKRMNTKVYDTARTSLKEFLTSIIHDATVYTMHAHRSTVTVNDVAHALKRNGRTLYTGFE